MLRGVIAARYQYAIQSQIIHHMNNLNQKLGERTICSNAQDAVMYSKLPISRISFSGIFAQAGRYLGNLDLLPNSPPLAGISQCLSGISQDFGPQSIFFKRLYITASSSTMRLFFS